MTNEDKDRLTNEEALKLLIQTPWLCSDKTIKLYPAIALAIKALEKQVPQMVTSGYIIGNVFNKRTYLCGHCGWKVGRGDSFCKECGWAIKWLEDEE